jgi:GT2 family glycosyltransferase
LDSPFVTAVVVSYQSRRTIGATLTSLRSSKDAGLIDVVVVDNDSRDGTPDYVRESFPWVKLIQAGGNLGYGRGCNLGFEHVGTPYTLFLNPDATLSQEALETLLDFIESRPRVGMCAPAIREEDGTMQVAGVLPTPVGLMREAIGLRGYPAMREIQIGGEPFRTNWLCGAILLARSEVVRAVKGFDPRFFLYFEETDLCRKITNEGFELWAVGAAFAEHECGASTKQIGVSTAHQCISEHYYPSRFYYLIKHHGWLAATLVEVGTILLLGVRTLLKRGLGRADDGALKERLAGPILRLPDRVELQRDSY